MINGIYPYLMAAGGAFKRFDNPVQNEVNNTVNAFRSAVVAEKESAGSTLATNEGIGLSPSGVVTPGSNGLFAQVADTSQEQEIPRMFVAQRGYEAYTKTARAEDEAGENSLDAFA